MNWAVKGPAHRDSSSCVGGEGCSVAAGVVGAAGGEAAVASARCASRSSSGEGTDRVER